MTDDVARQALLDAARHIDDMRAVLAELVGRLEAMSDRLARLSERHARTVERLTAIEARCVNDGK